jgi:hypothetical protein
VLRVIDLWHGPMASMEVVFLLFAARKHLGSHGIGGARCRISMVLFSELLFLILPSIGGVGTVLFLCRVLVALWGVDHGLSILSPSQFLVGPLRTKGTLG